MFKTFSVNAGPDNGFPFLFCTMWPDPNLALFTSMETDQKTLILKLKLLRSFVMEMLQHQHDEQHLFPWQFKDNSIQFNFSWNSRKHQEKK